MARINIDIQNEIHKKMKAICAIKGITLSEYINDSLSKKIKKKI